MRKVGRGDLEARAVHDDQPVRVDSARTTLAAPPISYLSVPLRRQRALVGVLAAFASHTRRPFSAQDTEVVRSSVASLVRLLN